MYATRQHVSLHDDEGHCDHEWTALGYAQLIECLGSLTRLGAFEEGSLAGALAVARLIDRGRILRSGLSAEQLRKALERYRGGRDWRPVAAIERALEQAIEIAAKEECRQPEPARKEPVAVLCVRE